MARPQDFIQRGYSLEQYRKIFSEADKDGNGYLTYKEFSKILKQMGYKGSKSKLKDYFKRIDTSGDKKLSEAEFLEAMRLIPEADHNSALLRLCFQNHDENRDGMIDRDELDQVLIQMGKILPYEEVDRMMKAADKDGSGKLDYEEFIALMYPVH